MTPTNYKKWSQRVTEESNALDLEPGVFTFNNPADIARSLKRSAECSDRRKADPFRSAMSMLTFYINRAGRQLHASQGARLEAAKDRIARVICQVSPDVQSFKGQVKESDPVTPLANMIVRVLA